MHMIPRLLEKKLLTMTKHFQVVGVIGQRQVGKTTLVKSIMSKLTKNVIYLDLERPSDRLKLDDAELFLSQQQEKTVIIDEVQHKRDLFPLLRALVDQTNEPGQFIILGSASPDLIRDSSESLAGRIGYLKLTPFLIPEISKHISQAQLWMKGGFPRASLASSDEVWAQWTDNFIRTYLERDLPMLGLRVEPPTLERFWRMLAHLSSHILNMAELAKSLGLTSPPIRRYLDFMENAFLIKRLYPFSSNTKKRLVKSPKVYLTDTGLMHRLLNITDYDDLLGHPSIGNSWETFAINQILSVNADRLTPHFFRTQHQAEIDLVLTKGFQSKAAIEIKYSNAPTLSKGNYLALDDIGAPTSFVITPSSDDYLFKEHIRICSLETFIYKYLPEI